jgi:hypothetical protein
MGGSAAEDSRAAAHLLEGWLASQPGTNPSGEVGATEGREAPATEDGESLA